MWLTPDRTAALARFDEYVARSLEVWKVPGVAVVVVCGDTVVLAKGYGVRKVGAPDPVTPETMFAVGSATKSFTAALVAMQVGAGAMGWDDRVTQHLPDFRVSDRRVTCELTVRDLLAHRSGLERADLVWYAGGYTREDLLRRARFLKQETGFRAQFGYNNWMYAVVGEVAARASGTSWGALVHDGLFTPLGMRASNASVLALSGLRDVATPHAEVGGTVRATAYADLENVAAAGAINTTAVDLSAWVRFQLAGGAVHGRALIAPKHFAEMHTPQVVVRREGIWPLVHPTSHFLTYGLGWYITDYRGRRLLHHGGNTDGMTSLVGLVPEEGLGFAVLCNLNGTLLPFALMNRLLDSVLAPGTVRDWSTDLRRILDRVSARGDAAEAERSASRPRDARPSHALARYAGVYGSRLYGEARVRVDGARLVLAYGSGTTAMVGDLEHWHADTFRARWRAQHLGRSFVTFEAGAGRRPTRMLVQALTTFVRRPNEAAPAGATAGATAGPT